MMKINMILISFLLLGIQVCAQKAYYFNKKRSGLLSAELTKLLPPDEPGAAIAITNHKKIIFEAYYGMANLSTSEKLNPEHVMGIASMSKQFVGMAIIILEQEGKINTNDEIHTYFPNLPPGGRKITIKQLLSHTSGLPELTKNDEFMNNIARVHTVDQIIEMGLKGDFRSEPGEKFIYCNTGYTIAVAMIEKISGMSYSSFLKKHIFDPLGMEKSYSCDFENDANNAVKRYVPDSSGFKNAREMHFSNLIGGGGIVSNVRDLSKWGMALLSGNKLPETYKKLWNPVFLNSGESTGYGFGMGKNEYEGIPYYYHPGMGDGMNSINMVFPDQKISITVIRNISSPKVSSKEIALLTARYLFTQ
jgi:CubicO group peptidase (beta-lactamase class C family)